MSDDDTKSKITTGLNSIGAFLEDMSSLEVQTFTGSLDVAIDDEGNIDDFAKLLASAKAAGNLKLCAVTKMMCDGDAINLVPEGDFPEHIQKVHAAAVKAGIDTRHGLLSLFGGMVGLTPGK